MALNDSAQEVVYFLLEKLKANGTFDEFRRSCVSNIDAKSAYQNWKQRIESNALKFLSQVEYTPELNKNIVWEKMRKHLLDGHETQDISDGADRILNQLLGPRTLDAFEPKILKVVNEYLGNENGTAPTEINGLNESTTSFKNIPENQINASFKLQTDLVSDIENMDNIEETSPEFEPLTSVLDNDNSMDESISGMSDLVSVGSPVQIVAKENNDTNSNGFETNTNPIENLLHTPFDKNGIVNHKIKNTNNESNSTNIPSNNSEKLKTNDLKSKSKHHSSRTSGHTNSEDKSSSNRSKNRNSNNHRSTSREKNDIKKRSNSNSKDRKNSSHTKHRSNSKDKDKKNKHKKSHQTDRDKTPKRDRKDSRSDKKEKSFSLCKEPKSLNGNRSDDESNAGGSSKQKSSINKNKSSTSEKSKSSSSNHKSNQKDNSSKEVVNKSKDKSSMSSSPHSSSQINNQTNKKRHKRALEDKFNNPNIVEKKIKVTNNQDSSMKYKEQDAADALLSISFAAYGNSQNKNKVIEKNLIIGKTLNNIDTAEDVIDVEENINQILSSSIDNKKENINSVRNNLKSSQPFDSIVNASEIDALKTNSTFDEVCVVDVKKTSLPCKNKKLETNFNECDEIYSKANKHNELIVDKKEVKTINAEINLISGANEMTSKHDSNTTLTVPKPKLLPNQIDAMKRKRYSKKKETKANKKKSLVSSSEVNVLVVDNISKIVLQNDNHSNCDADDKIKDSSITSTNILHKCHDNINTQTNCEASFNGFKGFSSTNGFYCKHYERLINIIKTLKEKKTQQSNIDKDGFKGFDNNTSTPCKYRDIVYGQLIKEMKKSTGFKGFTEDEVRRCDGYESVKNQLKLEQKTKENQQKTITHGGNGIQSEKTINKVIALMYKSKNDNDTTQNENFSQPDSGIKKDCPVVNNNNHNITPSDQWVVEQEMKYKLLPVKVQLERLMGYRCTNGKSISSKVSSTPQRNK